MAFIHLAGLGVMTSSVLRAICMTPFIFFVHRYMTWRKRRHQRSFGTALQRYILSRPVTLLLHRAILFGVVALGVHHAAAYWIAVSLTGIFNFYYGEKFSFGAKDDVLGA